MLARSTPPCSSNGVTAIIKTPEFRSLSIGTSRSLHPLRRGPRGRPPLSAITAGYRKIDARHVACGVTQEKHRDLGNLVGLGRAAQRDVIQRREMLGLREESPPHGIVNQARHDGID